MTQPAESAACIKVLLLEDNPGDARLVREVLEEASPGAFSLTHVDLFSKAERAVASENFDVVLLDLTLPDSFGIQTFRKMAHLTAAPIVVLTGLEDGAVEKQLMSEGASDYLPKRHLEGALLARILRNAALSKR